MILRAGIDGDGAQVTAIHAEGLATGHASFRADPMTVEDWSKYALRIVAEEAGQLLGWASVAPTSARDTYAGVGEVSIYVSTKAVGRGIGRKLLERLILESEAAGWWTLTASIFPENEASIALHKTCGFDVLGRRKRIGRMAYGPMSGVWRDTIVLERRSQVAGT